MAQVSGEGCRERIRQAVMNDDVSQQRLHAAEKRVAPAGEQQAVAQEGRDEEMTETLAASQLSSRRWASGRWQCSSRRWVWHWRTSKWSNCSAETDEVIQPSTWASSAASQWTLRQAGTWMMRSRWRKQRVRDEEPALLILSPVCRAFSTLIELTQTTGKLSEVKHWNFMERCVKHLKFCFRMYVTQRNARILYFHEHPWNAWSRDFSFFNEMAEKDGVHKTECDLFRFQLATNRSEKESWFMSNSECIMEGLSMRCYIRDGQAKNHMKKFV